MITSYCTACAAIHVRLMVAILTVIPVSVTVATHCREMAIFVELTVSVL